MVNSVYSLTASGEVYPSLRGSQHGPADRPLHQGYGLQLKGIYVTTVYVCMCSCTHSHAHAPVGMPEVGRRGMKAGVVAGRKKNNMEDI